MTHHRVVRRSFLLACAMLLAACPPPDDGTTPPDHGTGGGETPVRADRAPWAESPVTGLARDETARALEAVDQPLTPVAFLVRLDVAYAAAADDEEPTTRWARFGVVLTDEGLRAFDARPLEVADEAYGSELDAQPLAGLAEGLAGVPLLSEADCEAVGGMVACGPLLELASEATPPEELLGGSAPVRLAAGDRAVVAWGEGGALLLVDLAEDGAPRLTPLDSGDPASADERPAP